MDTLRGSSPSKTSGNDSPPEQLLDVFKAAALSVTKLYKASAAAQSKARTDGYQDCLDDLLAFLDKQNMGLSDGEGWKIRRWATERLDGRDTLQTIESDDEGEKTETASSPELYRTVNNSQLPTQPEPQLRTDSAPPPTILHANPAPATQPPQIMVPSQENFTFQSSMAYPADSDLNMSNLDLSDSRGNEGATHHGTSQSRPRNIRAGQRTRTSNHVNRVAGQKRKQINLAEIFDIGSLGGKDVFGSGGAKRSRHT